MPFYIFRLKSPISVIFLLSYIFNFLSYSFIFSSLLSKSMDVCFSQFWLIHIIIFIYYLSSFPIILSIQNSHCQILSFYIPYLFTFFFFPHCPFPFSLHCILDQFFRNIFQFTNSHLSYLVNPSTEVVVVLGSYFATNNYIFLFLVSFELFP